METAEQQEVVENTQPNVEPEVKADGEAPEVKVEAPKKDPDSRRFAILKKQAKDLQKQRESFKAENEAERARIAADLDRVKKFEESKPTNPIEALTRAGYSYEDLITFKLNDDQPTPELQVKAVKDEIEQLKQDQRADKERREQEAAQAQEAANRQAAMEYMDSVQEVLEQGGDSFEFIRLHDDAKELIAYVTGMYIREHGQVPEPLDVAQQVEKYYEDYSAKLAETKKLQSKMKPAAPTLEESTKPASSPKTRTLSNQMTATAASVANQNTRRLTFAEREADRMARAIAAGEAAEKK
jgi:hypothetical protein